MKQSHKQKDSTGYSARYFPFISDKQFYYRCPFSSDQGRTHRRPKCFSEHADEFIIEVCEKEYPMIQTLPIIHELCNIVYIAMKIFDWYIKIYA